MSPAKCYVSTYLPRGGGRPTLPLACAVERNVQVYSSLFYTVLRQVSGVRRAFYLLCWSAKLFFENMQNLHGSYEILSKTVGVLLGKRYK